MLLIPCVHCGPRAEIEFDFGGEARRPRPLDPAALSDDEWADYLYARTNPNGWSEERWIHSGGCGQWFILVRDTVSHEVTTAYLPPQPRNG